ncbi:MAG: flavodoxin domain-containing protein [Treponema sp.]|nr:flavodoxin domain-containing protein [Treponema sp.]
MKAIVIYNSQTGFTKQYAQWISEELSCEAVEFSKGAKMDLSDYDTIVFGSWCMAGTLTKLDWLKKNLNRFYEAGKKIAVYAVGASPIENPEVDVAMDKLFAEEDKTKVKVFYCPGGINYENMKPFSRFGMKMFAKALSSKKDATEKERKQGEMISHNYSLIYKKYLEPVYEYLRKNSD